jgi:hypothetical protein
MQARLPDGSVIISGFLAKDAEYKQVGGNNSKFDVVFCVGKVEKKPYTSKDGEEKVDVHLVCEAVFVQPTAEAAPPQELGGDLSDFEEVLNDEETPF